MDKVGKVARFVCRGGILTTMFLYTSDLVTDLSHIGVACLVGVHIIYMHLWSFFIKQCPKSICHNAKSLCFFQFGNRQWHAFKQLASSLWTNKSCLGTSFPMLWCFFSVSSVPRCLLLMWFLYLSTVSFLLSMAVVHWSQENSYVIRLVLRSE